MYRDKINKHLAEYKLAENTLTAEETSLAKNEQLLDDAKEAQSIIQQVTQIIQQEVHDRIARVVSKCLESIFDDPYQFCIDFERKRGRTEAILSFDRNGVKVDPLTASGGGVIDVASFALRLSCLLLVRPALRKVMIMDEPWKHLSIEYRARMRNLVLALSEEMGVQFIIITHSDDFKIGKVLELN